MTLRLCRAVIMLAYWRNSGRMARILKRRRDTGSSFSTALPIIRIWCDNLAAQALNWAPSNGISSLTSLWAGQCTTLLLPPGASRAGMTTFVHCLRSVPWPIAARVPIRCGFISCGRNPTHYRIYRISAAGDPLAGINNENVGKIKLYAWRGPDFVVNPLINQAGVDWILAENWWPYQRPSFVTPPFAGYISGHSTYSRAAAEMLTALTGDEYFPVA